jgi:hypothetical protein
MRNLPGRQEWKQLGDEQRRGEENTWLSEEWKKDMVRELLSSSNKEEDEDVERKKTENLAWTQKDAIIKGVLSSSSEEEEDKGGQDGTRTLL